MIRYMLESTLRVANHAPDHEEYRKSLGIRASTLPLSKFFFFSHLSEFPFATWVDRRALPILIFIPANCAKPRFNHLDDASE
jgi:hypothetical protein